MGYVARSVSVHATGLRLPTHLGLTKEGQLLVSEFAGGAVRDVTEEGDYADCRKSVYASQLRRPGGILPLADGRILLADSEGGDIFDISQAGRVNTSRVVFHGTPNPYGLVELKGDIFVSFFDQGAVGISKIDEGRSFSAKSALVRDFPCVTSAEPFPNVEAYGGSWPTAVKDDRLMLGHSALGTIFDVTSGGDFQELRGARFAWGLEAPGGMIADPIDQDLYVVERRTGVVRHVADEGYARFSRPLMAGFREPSCLRFTSDGSVLFIVDKAWDAIYRIDLARQDSSAS